VRRWAAWNEQFRTAQNPDRNTEYLLYQSMVGAWPIDVERIARYMEKATREAKQRTSWINPNDEFDKALHRFMESIYGHRQFIADLEAFVQELIAPGRISALAQVLLKLTAPGIPDLYQGMELWNLSLVDPDNRRPVDYAVRRQLLSEVASIDVEEVMKRSDEGFPKLWVTYHALRIRRAYPESLGERGEYFEIEPKGEKGAHVVAFRRGRNVITVVPRLVLSLNGDWGDTTIEIPSGEWKNELTGETISKQSLRMQDAFRRFPVALLVRER
jgi:(1->4)-alpha-D-glucan 1-alpha-D-glucosylmutase